MSSIEGSVEYECTVGIVFDSDVYKLIRDKIFEKIKDDGNSPYIQSVDIFVNPSCKNTKYRKYINLDYNLGETCETYDKKKIIKCTESQIPYMEMERGRVIFLTGTYKESIETKLTADEWKTVQLGENHLVTDAPISVSNKHRELFYKEDGQIKLNYEYSRISLGEYSIYGGTGESRIKCNSIYYLEIERENPEHVDQAIASNILIELTNNIIELIGYDLVAMSMKASNSCSVQKERIDCLFDMFKRDFKNYDKCKKRIKKGVLSKTLELYAMPKWDGIRATGIYYDNNIIIKSLSGSIFTYKTNLPFDNDVILQLEIIEGGDENVDDGGVEDGDGCTVDDGGEDDVGDYDDDVLKDNRVKIKNETVKVNVHVSGASDERKADERREADDDYYNGLKEGVGEEKDVSSDYGNNYYEPVASSSSSVEVNNINNNDGDEKEEIDTGDKDVPTPVGDGKNEKRTYLIITEIMAVLIKSHNTTYQMYGKNNAFFDTGRHTGNVSNSIVMTKQFADPNDVCNLYRLVPPILSLNIMCKMSKLKHSYLSTLGDNEFKNMLNGIDTVLMFTTVVKIDTNRIDENLVLETLDNFYSVDKKSSDVEKINYERESSMSLFVGEFPETLLKDKVYKENAEREGLIIAYTKTSMNFITDKASKDVNGYMKMKRVDTVDLEFISGNNNSSSNGGGTGENDEIIQFAYSNDMTKFTVLGIPWDIVKNYKKSYNMKKCIIECYYDFALKNIRFLRVRHDKTEADGDCKIKNVDVNIYDCKLSE